MIPSISFEEGQAHLTWIGVSDALAGGHDRPKAAIDDTFLYQGDNTMLSRSAWIEGLGVAVKTATIFPGNSAAGRSMVNGAVSLFSAETGELAALLDFHLVTKWKTAADSLLAARKLAPPDPRRALIIGAGTVGRNMAEAYRAAFPDISLSIWNRTEATAQKLAAEIDASLATDLESAVGEADLIATTTMSSTPVLQGDWLSPGTHLDLIGAYRPDMREVDDSSLRRARLFVDSFDTTLDHIGELKDPLARGVINRDDVLADFYDLDAFRRAPEDITICKNGGGAHLDLMTAAHILQQCDSA